MGYEMLTRTGKNFWEMTSVMQNAIRKGDYEIAGYAMWELLPKYGNYLRKRLLVISAEDCYGVLTKELLPLMDMATQESFEKALSILCAAKKNRDADYFVCNLMVNDTPSGLDKHELSKKLARAIIKKRIVEAGRLSAELFKTDRKLMWKMLNEITGLHRPHLIAEVQALETSNKNMTKPAEETIFVAKAMVLFWTEKPTKERLLAYDGMRFDGVMDYQSIRIKKSLDDCERVEGLFPEWAYNWHTVYGKYKLRRDAVHAIESDQRLLTPLEINLFDDCTWNRDINECLKKWNPRNRHIPYDDGKFTVEMKFPVSEEDGGAEASDDEESFEQMTLPI